MIICTNLTTGRQESTRWGEQGTDPFSWDFLEDLDAEVDRNRKDAYSLVKLESGLDGPNE